MAKAVARCRRVALAQRWAVTACLGAVLALGSSTASAQVSFNLKGPFPSGPQSDFRADFVAVGDIDEDKIPDIVVTNYGPETGPGNTSILWGEGDGIFSEPQALGDGVCPNGVALWDLDHDKHTDIVVANQCAGMVTIFWGSGTRTPRARQDLLMGNSAVPVGIADFDGDGQQDIATTDQTTATLWVLFNDGKGNFTPRAFSTCPGPGLAAIGQLNNSRRVDVFITSFWTSTICLLFNDGKGNFSEPSLLPGGFFSTAPAAVAEFTGDKNLDIAFARRGCFAPTCGSDSKPDGLAIYAGDGKGNYSEWDVVPVGRQPLGAAQGDLNFDGRSDVVVVNNESSSISVLLGQKAGGLVVATELPVDPSPNHATVADINQDGRPDILVANARTATVSVFLNETKKKSK